MTEFSSDELEKFAEAIRLLKLYRRAEMENSEGKDLIEQLYVDPLPHDHVLNQIRQPTTTFIVGRKGTGKSTIFLRAPKSLLLHKEVITAYVDIKTVFESSRVDSILVNALISTEGALSETALDQLLLLTTFLKAVVTGIRDDLRDQLDSSWRTRLREAFTGNYTELQQKLDKFVFELDNPNFINIQGIRTAAVRKRSQDASVITQNPLGKSASLRSASTARELRATERW